MKSRQRCQAGRRFFLVCLFSLAFVPDSLSLFEPLEPRPGFADRKEPVTIAVFFPSVGTIEDLLALRKERLIDLPDLAVVGIYHEKENTDYGKAEKYAQANGLEWLTFHPVSAPLAADGLYRENACTPEFRQIFDRVDGVIFFGGPDIPPPLYGEKTSLLAQVTDPYRHFLELSFIFHLLGGFQDESFIPYLRGRPEFPIFGICLGCQSLAVGTGGALTQDIWSEIYGLSAIEDVISMGSGVWHTSPFARLFPRKDLFRYALHRIQFDRESKFSREMQLDPAKRPLVLSAHHQQIKKMGRGFYPAATSLDGKVVEAVEHRVFPNVLGVQFHPEMSALYDRQDRVYLSPQETEPKNLRTVLESDTPSWQFHRRLWSWVSRSWVESHRERRGKKSPPAGS